jgi:TrpR-related protein YerC/YecD
MKWIMFEPIVKNPQTDMLIKAVISLENEEDAYRFFEDLCTIPEIRSISQRLAVARLLRKKETYQKIAEETGASTATISRVNRALTYGADGYNRVLNEMEKNEAWT